MRLLISKKFLFISVILAFSLEAKMISRTQVIMDTYITIWVDTKDKQSIDDAFRIFKNVDESLSSYNPLSPIYKLNLTKQVSLNPLTYKALSLSEKYYKQTYGYFDITVGSITKELFHFGEKERIPSNEELTSAYINFDALSFDRKYASIKQDVKVDLGGMGKGFGVDRVSDAFKAKCIIKARIAASGDIRCIGKCKIDIQNPFVDEALVSFTTLSTEMGISTSGNYNRYVDSVENNHLINPKLKRSQDKFVSITLISTIANSDLDAYATASSVMPTEVAFKFLDSLDLAYVILKSDGTLHISENISKFTQDLVVNYTRK